MFFDMNLKTNIKHSLLENIMIIIELEKISMYQTEKSFCLDFISKTFDF